MAAGIGAALLGGAAVGYAAERALVRSRLVPDLPPSETPLGSIGGEPSTVAGPDGIDVAVESYGPPDAQQLVLAHGWVCTGRAWHEVVRRLKDRYRIVTFDLPGHGRTSSPASGQYDLDLLGDTLAAVVDASTRPGPLVVSGHSLGGMSVLNAVRRHRRVTERLRGAVLLSTTSSAKGGRSEDGERLGMEWGIRAAARLDRGIRRMVPTLRHPRVTSAADRLTSATSDLSYLLARWTGVGPDADPEVVAFTRHMATHSSTDVIFGLLEAVLGVDEDGGLDALADVPTTLLVGTHDRITPLALSQRMADRSAARLRILDDVGHMSLLEAGERVVEVVVEHLEGRVRAEEDTRPTHAQADGAPAAADA